MFDQKFECSSSIQFPRKMRTDPRIFDCIKRLFEEESYDKQEST